MTEDNCWWNGLFCRCRHKTDEYIRTDSEKQLSLLKYHSRHLQENPTIYPLLILFPIPDEYRSEWYFVSRSIHLHRISWKYFHQGDCSGWKNLSHRKNIVIYSSYIPAGLQRYFLILWQRYIFLTSPTKRFFLSFFERSASISLISFRVLCTRSMLFVRIISSVRQRVRYCISAFFGSLEHILTILVLVRSMEIILLNISFVWHKKAALPEISISRWTVSSSLKRFSYSDL